jgi:hypothetical protein
MAQSERYARPSICRCRRWVGEGPCGWCKVVSPIREQFWGDRYGEVQTPLGFILAIATRTGTQASMDDCLASA